MLRHTSWPRDLSVFLSISGIAVAASTGPASTIDMFRTGGGRRQDLCRLAKGLDRSTMGVRSSNEHQGSIMHPHQVPSTTHTVEMEQMAELSSGLRERDPSQPISASALGLQGVELISGSDDDSGLPGDAILERVSFDGPPEFPYVHAHFRGASADQDSLKVDLHTDALRELSRLLHLQHTWGAGRTDTEPRP